MNDQSLNSVTVKSNVYSNRTCQMCEFTDGLCYTSNPPKCKCTITGQYRFYDDPCNVPIDQLISHGNNTNKPKVNDFSSKPLSTSDIIKESITVKGFNSLVNVIKLLVEGGYSFSFKATDKNKYNENTHLTIEYYKENISKLTCINGSNNVITPILDGVANTCNGVIHQCSDKAISDEYRNYLVNKHLSNSHANGETCVVYTDTTKYQSELDDNVNSDKGILK